MLKAGHYVYYKDCFGFKSCGKVIKVWEDTEEFLVSANPNTSLPQMDDSRRILKFSDEGKLFWLYPTPEHPIPLEIQKKINSNK